VETVITFTDGSQQVKITSVTGVYPSLLRTLSTHIDWRNRQAQNQLSPDVGLQQVNVNLGKELRHQTGVPAGLPSAADWSAHAIDVRSGPI
jgi:hypothetical protein